MALDIHKLIREDGSVHRNIYTDPAIFNEELKRIWQKSWLYVAHESEIPNPGDFKSLTLAHQPVIIVRGEDGQIRVLFNTCRHRSVMVCHQEKGTTTHFTCTFHGWVYNTKGNLVGLSGPDHSLRKFKERRGLASVRRLDAYRGLIFASLGADGESLDEHLGKAKFFIDLVMDQSTEGIEVIEGMHRSRQKRNWKLQIENGIDGDYGDRTRANSSRAPEERIKSSEEGQTVDFTGPQGFAKDLGNGHVLLQFPVSPQHRVINQRRAELEQRLGAERTQRICETERNLFIFPNLFLIDQTATSLRIINPIAPDYTEQTVIPFAPKGEPIEMIHQRLRYYTTSLSPAAFGEQDDFDALAPHLCGYAAEGVDWQDSSEGVHPERADKGGEGEYVGAVASATAQWGQYRQWKKLMAQDG